MPDFIKGNPERVPFPPAMGLRRQSRLRPDAIMNLEMNAEIEGAV
jgi:hypothetical protein